MVSLYFDEEHHPEMLSVPLKGEYLKEFLALCRQVSQSERSIALSPEDRALRQIREEVINEVAKGLSGSGAAQYGIDTNDLRVIIDNVAKIDSRNVYSGGTYRYANEALEEEFGEEKYNEAMKKCMSEMAAESLMNYFSSCLAAQEHKEKYYVDMVSELYKERLFPEFKAAIASLGELSEIGKVVASIQLARFMVGPLLFYNKNKERNSLIAKMDHDIIFGKNSTPGHPGGLMGQFHKANAEIHGLDTTKLAHRERLRLIEKLALEQAALSTGMKLPSSPELG